MNSKEFAELEDRLEGWERDAMRYRWLRQRWLKVSFCGLGFGDVELEPSDDESQPDSLILDRAIDAGMVANKTVGAA